MSGRRTNDQSTEWLEALAQRLGPVFDNETQALGLYRHVRERQPTVIVELGTGLALSALAMAGAARANRQGCVYSVDDMKLLRREPRYLALAARAFDQAGLGQLRADSPTAYFAEVIRVTGLSRHLKFVPRRIDLSEDDHFDSYPFGESRIDLLFADFAHGPDDLLDILTHFLPRMGGYSTIIFDSVPGSFASRLLLDKVVKDLNALRISTTLQRHCRTDLARFMRRHRLEVTHVTTGNATSAQFGSSWLEVTEKLPATYESGHHGAHPRTLPVVQ